jgi:hypothetical protein
MKRSTEKNIHQDRIMERPLRKSTRFSVKLMDKEAKYLGYTTDMSARGVGIFINTHFDGHIVEFKTDSTANITIQSPLGSILSLVCRVRWCRIHRGAEHDATTRLGLEVIDPPADFLNLFGLIP